MRHFEYPIHRLALRLGVVTAGAFLMVPPLFAAQAVDKPQGQEQSQEVTALRELVSVLQADLRSMDSRLETLETQLATMEEAELQVGQLPPAVEEELERLEERQADDRQELMEAIENNRRTIAPLVFTPALTMFGNAAGRLDSKPVVSPEGDRIDDQFMLRAAEFELRAAVDPYADAFLAIPLEAETPNGTLEADVEEAYVLLKGIPRLTSLPGGLKLKIGKYRPEIGKNNLIHFHDLMWTTRPLPVATFLGTEGLGVFAEAGFQATGVNTDFFLPSPSENATLTSQFGVAWSGNLAVTRGNEGKNPIFYTHQSWYQRVNDSQALELGGSYLNGAANLDGSLRSQLAGADFTYTWKPGRLGQWRSLVAGGEFFYASIERPDLPASTPLGFYLFGQYQPTRNFYLGGRYDYAQALDDERIRDRNWSAYLTHYTSEFLRFRLGFEHRMSDVAARDGLNTFLFELNFVFGVHPAEPYWVSR